MHAEQAYLFRHALLREVAYGLWLPSDRSRLHTLAIDVIEHAFAADLGRVAGELAEHCHRAMQDFDPAQDAQALEDLRRRELKHLRVARQLAYNRLQDDLALLYALRLLASPLIERHEALEVELLVAEQHQLKGRFSDALACCKRVRADPDCPPVARVKTWVAEGRIAAFSGRRADAEQLMETAASEAKAFSLPDLQAQATSWLAGFYEDSGRAHLCEAMHRRAAEIAQSPGMRLAALGNLANHLRSTGRLDEAVAVLEEVLAGFERLGDVRAVGVACNNLGRTYFMLGRLDESEAAYLRSLEVMQPAGRNLSFAFSQGNVAEVWQARGQPQRARKALSLAIQVCDEYAYTMHGAAFRARLAALLLLMGDADEAAEVIEDARNQFAVAGTEQYITGYCDIVRVRLAAEYACKARPPGPPAPAWLPVIRQLNQGISRALAAQKAGDLELKRSLEASQAVLGELEAAAAAGRPAVLWRGYLPSESSVALRKALLEQGRGQAQTARLLAAHPALEAAMKAGF